MESSPEPDLSSISTDCLMPTLAPVGSGTPTPAPPLKTSRSISDSVKIPLAPLRAGSFEEREKIWLLPTGRS